MNSNSSNPSIGSYLEGLIVQFLYRSASFCFLVTIAFSSGALAQIFHPDEFMEQEARNLGYTSPNEHNIQEAQEIFELAPEGAYVAVGTERGLIGAGYIQNPTHVILIDVDRQVVYFNRYNVALIKISSDREDYLYLREHASFEELQARINRPEIRERLLDHERDRLSSQRNFDNWRTAMGQKYHQYLNQDQTRGLRRFKPFGDSIYLRDDEVCFKIKSLADQNLIESHNIDFRNRTAVSALVEGLAAAEVKVSVLDVSNAWWRTYTPVSAFQNLIQEFSKVTYEERRFFDVL